MSVLDIFLLMMSEIEFSPWMVSGWMIGWLLGQCPRSPPGGCFLWSKREFGGEEILPPQSETSGSVEALFHDNGILLENGDWLVFCELVPALPVGDREVIADNSDALP